MREYAPLFDMFTRPTSSFEPAVNGIRKREVKVSGGW